MHAIHIRIGGEHYFVIAQVVHAILNVQGMLEQIELFVFIDDLLV